MPRRFRILYIIRNRRAEFWTNGDKWSKKFKDARLYSTEEYAETSVKRVREVSGDNSAYITKGVLELTEVL